MQLTLFAMSLFAFCLTALACWWIASQKMSWVALDHANHRSMHQKSIPRAGGLAIFVSFALSIYLAGAIPEQLGMLAGLGFIFILSISVLDDYRHIVFFIRLFFHVIAISLLLLNFHEGLATDVLGISMPLILVWLLLTVSAVWFVNLFNFMDGMDGFAASMSIVACLVLAFVGFTEQQRLYVEWTVVLGSAVMGFMLFNKPKAKLFLGDIGSIGLAFTFVFLILWGLQLQLFSIIFILILFLPFWLDASVTLLLRIFRGEAFWQAHNQHYYQKLAKAIGSSKALMLELVLILVCACCALLVRKQSFLLQLLVLTLIVLSLCTVYLVALRQFLLRKLGKIS